MFYPKPMTEFPQPIITLLPKTQALPGLPQPIPLEILSLQLARQASSLDFCLPESCPTLEAVFHCDRS